MDRVHRPRGLSTSDAELDTGRVRRAGHAHLGRSGIVRGNHIHGAGPDHHAM